MENTIIINKELALYLSKAANAFDKYKKAFFNKRNNYDDKKIAKEKYYNKIIFFQNIDNILDRIDIKKGQELSTFIKVLNFIMSNNYRIYWCYNDCGWPEIPEIKAEDLYFRNGRFPKNKAELIEQINDNLCHYNRITNPLTIKQMIGMKF